MPGQSPGTSKGRNTHWIPRCSSVTEGKCSFFNSQALRYVFLHLPCIPVALLGKFLCLRAGTEPHFRGFVATLRPQNILVLTRCWQNAHEAIPRRGLPVLSQLWPNSCQRVMGAVENP